MPSCMLPGPARSNKPKMPYIIICISDFVETITATGEIWGLVDITISGLTKRAANANILRKKH